MNDPSLAGRALPTTIPQYLAQLRVALEGADPAMVQDALAPVQGQVVGQALKLGGQRVAVLARGAERGCQGGLAGDFGHHSDLCAGAAAAIAIANTRVSGAGHLFVVYYHQEKCQTLGCIEVGKPVA